MSEKGAEIAEVPCGSCRRCCTRDLIILHPEMGDDPRSYKVVKVVHPLTGADAYAIERGADGNCVYLGPEGCTIHGRHPVICREFDCGKMYERTTRAERRKYVAQGQCSKAVFDQGRRVTLIRNGQRVA